GGSGVLGHGSEDTAGTTGAWFRATMKSATPRRVRRGEDIVNRRIEQLLVEMAEEVHQEPAQAIERIAEYARSAVNGEDSGILLTKAKGRVETPAGTSARVTEAHALQGELDEGPCLDAVRTDEHTRLVTDTATDERWPRWAPRTM